MPFWILSVDGDFLRTRQSEIPAKKPPINNNNKHVGSDIMMDVFPSPVLRVCVSQRDGSCVVYRHRSKDVLFNGHRQNGVTTVIDVLSCSI